MNLPDIEDRDIEALQEALMSTGLPPKAVKMITKMAERGLAPRDPVTLKHRVEYLFTLQNHLTGFDAVKMSTQ